MLGSEYGMGFTPMAGEPSLYRKAFVLDGVASEILVGQYVDDCMLAASSQSVLGWFLTQLGDRFPVNPNSSGLISLSDPGFILSMHVHYDMQTGTLKLNQLASIEALAKKFNLTDPKTSLHKVKNCLPLHPDDNMPKLDVEEKPGLSKVYLSMIGSCLHISQVSRPDIAYAVGVLARHASTPGEVHMSAARDLITCLFATRHWSIQYTRTKDSGNKTRLYEHGTFEKNNAAIEAQRVRSIEERLVASTPEFFPNSPDTYMDANLAGERLPASPHQGSLL